MRRVVGLIGKTFKSKFKKKKSIEKSLEKDEVIASASEKNVHLKIDNFNLKILKGGKGKISVSKRTAISGNSLCSK